jgi:group II intron reverse transcriptase/maturase
VSTEDAEHQKPTPTGGPNTSKGGEADLKSGRGETSSTTDDKGSSGNERLMEEAFARDNALKALKRVMQNKGSPGIDGMTVEEFPGWMRNNWTTVRAQLLDGTYRPKPVRLKEIPKGDGGVRKLGIPTLLDRFIQQCLLQVLQPAIDPTFSQHSYGFRPGRSAHDALEAAMGFIKAGYAWVVDVDIEKFFDHANHDVLMGRLIRRVADKRVLRLIRAYLNAGMMVDGVVVTSEEGTPQGSPLSPLLANVLLDDVDKELEKRGHAFVRYADDCNVYVHSEKAGLRVYEGMKKLLGKLRLRVNETKSRVAPATEPKFLGHRFERKDSGEVILVVHPKALEKLRNTVRELTSRAAGLSMATVIAALNVKLRGWRQYFRLVPAPRLVSQDEWIRRRLRALQLKQWKTPRRIEEQMRRAAIYERAAKAVVTHHRRYWAVATWPGMTLALRNSAFRTLGLYSLNVDINPPNRRIRSRTSGGVGGGAAAAAPLSR